MFPEYHTRRAGSRLTSAALLTLGTTLLLSAPALATDWYVDGKYGGTNNPGSLGKPFKYFWQANQRAQPGDYIYLQPNAVFDSTLWVTASGAPGKPITISGLGYAPNLTKVSGGGHNFGISIAGSYVTVINLDVTAPGIYSAIHIPQYFHNINIILNRIHDAGGNGVDAVGNDYVQVLYNTVSGNAKDTSEGQFASGISIKGGVDIDDNTAPKMIINGNVVYGNTNTPTCYTASCYATASDSDGSGIIIDNNRRTLYNNVPYRGHFLVSNNIVYGNGGRGIHMYLSDHILVTGNSVYSNNQDPYEGNYRPGEITGDYVADVTVTNNIVDSDGGTGIDGGKNTGTHVPISFEKCGGGSGEISISHNLGFRPENDPDSFLFTKANAIPVVVSANLWGNPDFVRPSLNPQIANFLLQKGSLAFGHGQASPLLVKDKVGLTRASPITIGAYETTTN